MPPAQLDQYELQDVIGVGTVGTVYLSVDPVTGDRVAIKRLHANVSRDQLIRSRFQREMSILERLHHPNIVAYLGGGDDDQSLYYVMELVDGGSVKEVIESTGRLPWIAVVEVGIQVCSALQWAHNHGVIHRDLKPGNLFLTRKGEIKLGDFGIARDLTRSDLSAQGMTVGTHAYMAPEQIVADPSITGQVDLYALGCCLFEMLTGRKPFLGDNYAQLFEQHLKAKPPRVRELGIECPLELDALVDQLLAKQPADRPFNARRAQATLLSVLEAASASELNVTGREIMIARIEKLKSVRTRPDVSWQRLVLMVAVFALIGVIAAIVAR